MLLLILIFILAVCTRSVNKVRLNPIPIRVKVLKERHFLRGKFLDLVIFDLSPFWEFLTVLQGGGGGGGQRLGI